MELTIYFILACICFYKTREFIAKGNGAFYSKNKTKNLNPLIKKEVKNYHLIAAPLHKLLFGGIFFLLMIITRLLDLDMLTAIIISLVITIAMSGTASYKWQYWVTISDKEFIDYPKYELTFKAFGKVYSWWIPRGFKGPKQRKIVSQISWGILTIIIIMFYIYYRP